MDNKINLQVISIAILFFSMSEMWLHDSAGTLTKYVNASIPKIILKRNKQYDCKYRTPSYKALNFSQMKTT